MKISQRYLSEITDSFQKANRLNFVDNKTIGKQGGDRPVQEIPYTQNNFEKNFLNADTRISNADKRRFNLQDNLRPAAFKIIDNFKKMFSIIPAFAAETLDIKSISSFNYTYDNVGNRLDKVTVRQEQLQETYGYDDIYQLTGVSGDQTHSYDYDAVGNRQVVDGTSYSANNLNQYSVVGSQNYSYDQNGNLTSDGTNTYTYDFENRLITASGGGHNSSYTYDGFGRRISKTVDGIATYFIYDGDQVIEERDASGSLETRYTYGSGIDEVIQMRRDAQNYYYFADGLGSITELLNVNGSVVESYSYDGYGAPSQTSAIGNPYMFTGRKYEPETGLYYYRARHYSPAIGRFLQRDPLTWGPDDPWNLGFYAFNKETTDVIVNSFGLIEGIDGQAIINQQYSIPSLITQTGTGEPFLLQLYLYCSNSPTNWIDPFGYDKQMTMPPILFVGGMALAAEPTQIGKLVIVGAIIGIGIYQARKFGRPGSFENPLWLPGTPGGPNWKMPQKPRKGKEGWFIFIKLLETIFRNIQHFTK